MLYFSYFYFLDPLPQKRVLVFSFDYILAHGMLEERKQNVRILLEILIVLLSKFALSTRWLHSATMLLNNAILNWGGCCWHDQATTNTGSYTNCLNTRRQTSLKRSRVAPYAFRRQQRSTT